MADKIIMPQGGQDLQFGTIVRWLKKEGDTVKRGELICEVETEKAVFEVNASRDGVLLKILKQDGEEAEVLSAIGFIGDDGEKIEPQEETSSVKNTVIKENTISPRTVQRLPGEKVRISPRARKLARDNGIDIRQLGSDRPDGKITTEIVQKAISAGGQQPQKLDISNGHAVKMGRMQRIAADRLSHSWRQAPHFFITVAVDVTDLLAARKQYNNGHQDKKISVNDLAIKASAIALKEIPQMNASYLDQDTIVLWDDIHIGVAVSTDDGLLVSVLAHADSLSLVEIAQQTKLLVEDARNRKFSSDVPSRFTISNLGMYDVDQFTAIINPPESAILAVASAQRKAVVDEDDTIVVRDMMDITLSLDHRVGDGVLAARFINRIKQLLEAPEQLGINKPTG